jgi:hypothetical protein
MPWHDGVGQRAGEAAMGVARLVPLRPLGIGEVLDGAVEAIRRNPRTTLTFGAALMAVQQAVNLPVQYLLRDLAVGGGTGAAGFIADVLALSASAAVLFLVGTALSVVLGGAMAVVVGDGVQGRASGVTDVWARLAPRFPALLGLGLAVALATGLGLTVGLGLGAVGVFVVTAVTAPVFALEHAGVAAAFRRSWQLTIRDFWRVLGVRAVGVGVSSLMTFVLALPFTIGAALLGGGPFATSAAPLSTLGLTALGALVAGTVAGPFSGCVDGLLYVDRRMRAEGLDIDLAQRARA